MPTKYVDQEELEGKTIAKIYFEGPPILIAFTDGTWTKITYDGGYYPGEGELRFDDCLNRWEVETLTTMGIKFEEQKWTILILTFSI